MNTEILLLRYGTLDLYTDEAMLIDYGVNDIKSLSSTGKASYMKQFEFPSTPKNDRLLNYIFHLNSNSTFKANKKVEVSVMEESIEILPGYFQLTDIVRNKFDKIISYKATVYGYGVDLLKTLDDLELTDLDLYEYNHTRNMFTVQSSWTAGTQNGYVYPLIDYAAGLTYPSIAGSIPVQLSNMKPAVYVKTLWDAMFRRAGYSYESSFINDTFFQGLIIPNSNEFLTYSPSGIGTSNLFKAYKTADQTIVKAAPTNTTFTVVNTSSGSFIRTAFEDDATLGNDPGNNYTTLPLFGAPYTYFVPSDDDYSFKAVITALYQSGTSGVPGTVDVTIERDSTAAGVMNQTIGSASINLFVTQSNTITCTASTVSLLAGDKIYVRVRFTTGPTPVPQNLDIYGSNQSYFECTSSGILGQVSPIGYVDIATNLPPKVKCKDFITSIFKMFDMRVEPIGNKKLLIEPRDIYYTKGKRRDLNGKLDISKPIESKILSELKSNNVEFKFSPDNDFLNADYTKQSGKVYGEHKIEFDNDFVTGTETIQLIFAPTPLDNVDGSQGIIIPRIYNQDENGLFSKVGCKIRILYYAGLIDLSPFGERWKVDYSPISFQGFQVRTYTSYPYAGQLTHPYDIENALDLNWTNPDYIYYVNPTTGVSGYTSQGLFRQHYKLEYDEISNSNSRLLTAYFNLDVVDIANYSFKDLYFFEEDYYRLNKIQYNASGAGRETSKMELLKLISSRVPITSIKASPKRLANNKPNSGINYGYNKGVAFSSVIGFNNSISDDSIFNTVFGTDNLVYSGSQNTSVIGTGNTVFFVTGSTVSGNGNYLNSASTIFISGINNTADTATNSAIIASSGTSISSGSSGVVMLGVDNYTGVTQNNTTYVTYLNVLSGLSISGLSVVTDAINIGLGAGQVYSGKTGSTLMLRTISGATNIIVQTVNDHINISTSQEPVFSSVTVTQNFYSGGSNLTTIINNSVSGVTGLNIGSGIGQVFSAKTGNTFFFKTLSAGTNLILNTASTVNSFALSQTVTGLTSISATSISATTFYSGSTLLSTIISNAVSGITGQNIGTGTGVYSGKTGNTLMFKTLIAGNNISLSNNTTGVTITNSYTNPLHQRNKCTDVNYSVDKDRDWLIVVDKNTAGVTITLPSSPSDNQEFVIKDAGNATTYNVVIDGNGNNIDGSTTYTLDRSYQSIALVYSSCAACYLIVYDYVPPSG